MEFITKELLSKSEQIIKANPAIGRRKLQQLLDISEPRARFIVTFFQSKELLNEYLQSSVESKVIREENGDLIVESPISSTVDELLERFEIDKDYWQVTRSIINEWGSINNYNRQAKAWLQRKGDIIDWEIFKRDFIEDVKQHSPEIPKLNHKFTTSGKLQQINIFDLHLGKLAWHEESTDNYDNKIAQERFYTALDKLVRAGEKEMVEKILFPVGNDFFNSDYHHPFPRTTKGTPQESDIRWQKSFRIGRQLIISAIEMLKKVAPVEVVVIPGNHEKERMFYLGDLLEVKYQNDENVHVNNSPKSRKYIQWGKNLIGLTHGEKVPYQRLLSLMPQEEPFKWAATKYREWHLGHKHSGRKLIENLGEDNGGITIRHFRTLMTGDSYESEHGWFSMGGAETLFWDKHHGLTTISHYNL